MRKSDGLGSPTGRDARTTRLACAMVASSGFYFLEDSVAKRECVRQPVIPGRAKREPGISRFSGAQLRTIVRSCVPARNDGAGNLHRARIVRGLACDRHVVVMALAQACAR